MDLPLTPVTAAELAERGLSRKRLRLAVESGELRRVLRGVYVSAAAEDDLSLRIAAAQKVVPPGHVIVDRTAAWLHGVAVFGLAESALLAPPVETATPVGAATDRHDLDGHKRALAPEDVTELGGVRVTTALRTGLDLGCALRRREAYAAMVGLARAGDFGAEAYVDVLPRFRRRRGVRQLRGLAGLVDPRIESPREAWVYLALADAGIPLPEPQVWVEVDGVPTYRLDFAYRARRLAIEYDGEEYHGPAAAERDAARRGWLRRHGWTVIVVRKGDFTGPALDRWIREVRVGLRGTYSTRRW